MLLIGHDAIAFKPFYAIHTFEEVQTTPSCSIVLFDFNTVLAKKCADEKILFALHVKQIKELILANALGASYFIVTKSLALQAQKNCR
ncbi:MAG: hypothetical protein LRY68_12820 [Sulfurospirillum sp.]|nr:hypothetical protein [Sulfurospirillum sp.]